MAINIVKNSGHVQYGLKEFVIDSENELTSLPVDCPQGSTAFVIENSNKYILNGSKTWILISSAQQNEEIPEPGIIQPSEPSESL